LTVGFNWDLVIGIYIVNIMHSYRRSTRVGELIQQEISKIVREIKEPGIGLVTITGVKLTDDLQDARIFYSVLGSPEELEKAKTILNDSVKSIRHELAVRLNLRRTPVLVFAFDDTPERANRIFEILEKIEKEEKPGE